MQTLSVSSSSGSKPVKVGFLCEQVSHHPPISSAYYSCPEKGIEAYGVDQISAKVAGMSEFRAFIVSSERARDEIRERHGVDGS
jgi:hypothetical protein